MSDADLNYATITDLAPRLESGALSPVELTRACLDRIAALDGSINAFITVLEESALAEARQAEQEIRGGHYRGPLHGIPIAHKDLFYTRGVRTTAGSKILADFVPDFDGTVVDQAACTRARCFWASSICTSWRRAAPATTRTMARCTTRGTCAATRVARAAAPPPRWRPACVTRPPGSDTAGSIRIPSHACGTTGIKPTYGRVSCYGVVPLSWSLDHVGPMTRSVRDAALLLNVMAGYDPRDPASVDQPVAEYTAELDARTARAARRHSDELLQ